MDLNFLKVPGEISWHRLSTNDYGDDLTTSGASTSDDACPLSCTGTDSSSPLSNKCTEYQFPMVNGSNVDEDTSSSKCPSVTWTEHASDLGNQIYSGGNLYYCADASPTGDAAPCGNVQTASVTGPCNEKWSQLRNINSGIGYAQYWDSSCDNMAKKMVENGDYKSVACFNQTQSLFDIETGEYAQAWPSTGYDVSAVDWANGLACQLNHSNTVTECGELGNLCDTRLFSEDYTEEGEPQIFEKSSDLAVETIGAIIDAIGDAL